MERITITFGGQVVEWPIVRTTDKALCLKTPGGEFWVPKSRWRHLPLRRDATGLQELLGFIQELTSTHKDARVAVRRAGKGSSDLSCKVSFAVRRFDKDAPGANGLGAWVASSKPRTATIPVSVLTEESGQLTAPLWVLEKKLNASGEKVAGTTWTGMPAVRAQLQAALNAAQAAQNQAAQEQEQRSQVMRDPQLQAQLAVEAAHAICFAKLQRLNRDELKALGVTLGGLLPSRPLLQFYQADPPRPNTVRLARLRAVVEAVSKHPGFSAWRAENAETDVDALLERLEQASQD